MEGVTVAAVLLTSMTDSGCRCEGWAGKARQAYLPCSGAEGGGQGFSPYLSTVSWRQVFPAQSRDAKGRQGDRCGSHLWQVVCSGNLISTSEAHCRLPVSCSPQESCLLSHPQVHFSYLVCRDLSGIPRNHCSCLQSPSAFSKVIST